MRKEIEVKMNAQIDSLMSNVDNDKIRNIELARAAVERIKANAQEESDKLDTEKAGKATWDIYQSYITAGFTEEQAWELLTIRMKNAFKGGN